MTTWVQYKQVQEGERIWKSYRASDTLGTMYREVFSYVDPADGVTLASFEVIGLVPAPDAPLAWVKDSDSQDHDRREEVWHAPITGGKMVLSVTSYSDAASGYFKSGSASMQVASTTVIAGGAGALTHGDIFVGNASNLATAVPMSGEASISDTGSMTLGNAGVIGKVLTGFISGTGTIAATDSILAAIQKADGNTIAAAANANAALGQRGFEVVKYHPTSPYALESGKQLVVLLNNDDVCNLPAATGSGRVISFRIEGTVANIYPASGEQIDALGASNQLQIWAASPYGKVCDVAAGQWLTII